MYILFVSDYLIHEIKEIDIYNCYQLNQANTPNVGSESSTNFEKLVINADYTLCVKNTKVIAFAICFTDSIKTISYLNSINHKNFKELNKLTNNFLYVDRIAVDENCRHLGLGSELYKKIINYGKSQNFTSITAEINYLPIKNDISFNFHKKHGFEEIAVKKYSKEYEVSFQKCNIN